MKAAAPQTRCIPGRCAPRTPCTLGGLHSSDTSNLGGCAPITALGGCTLKTLQWLRCLLAIQRVKNCNQVAKPMRGVRAAASKCKGLKAQLSKCRRFGRRSSPMCSGSQERSLLECTRISGASAPQEHPNLQSGRCTSRIKTETVIFYSLEQNAYTTTKIENLDFIWRLQRPRSRCIPGSCAHQTPCTFGSCAPQTP